MGFNASSPGPFRGAEILLRDLVYERTGLMFDNSKLDLFIGKLAPLIKARGFDSALDYFYLLKYDAGGQDAWNDAIDALTVQETYFWREMDQIHALSEILIPILLRDDPTRKIKIWSAACATGEEPATIAMRLNEDAWFDRADIEIRASDVSKAALDRAQEGTYCGRAFRALPDHLKNKYFRPAGKCWSISPSILGRIEWGNINLLEAGSVTEAAEHVSVIFCRNAFIYFDTESTRNVVNTFARAMSVPGYLFVGAAESLMRVTDYFELEELGNAFVYTKHR
jgi:chemotaxis protein methyltransferase CheR